MRAYDDLIRQGKLLYWGVSHWNGEQIAAGCAVADRQLAVRPISNQPSYSILVATSRPADPRGEREAASDRSSSVPLAQGALTGKYGAGRRPEQSRASDPKRNRWMQEVLKDDVLARIDQLRPIADELGLLPRPARARLVPAGARRRERDRGCDLGPPSSRRTSKAARRRAAARSLARIDALFPGPVPGPGDHA